MKACRYRKGKVTRMKHSIFRGLAAWLYKIIRATKLPFFSGRQIEADLIQLHPGENPERVKEEYYVKKLSLLILMLLLGTVFAVVVKYGEKEEILLDESGVVQRGSPGSEEIQLRVRADYGEESYEFLIPFPARTVGEQEAKQLLSELKDNLESYVLGNNASLQKVSDDLILSENYGDYPVEVEWQSSREDVISVTGKYNPTLQCEDVMLKAFLNCDGFGEETVIEVKTLPKTLSEKDRIQLELEEYLLQTEKSSRQQENWQLPVVWDGEKISWMQVSENKALMLWIGAVGAAILVYFFSDRDLHESLERRKRMLKQGYADFVYELVLLVGAGMMPRGAFGKLAEDYEKKKALSGKSLPVYEEVVRTCREMQSGVAEGAAYERFGRRTGLQEYIRLSGLLVQNLKRGNRALPERLREEAEKAGSREAKRS